MCNIFPVSEIWGSLSAAMKTTSCMLGCDIMYVTVVRGTEKAGVYEIVMYLKDGILYVDCRFSSVYVVFCVAQLRVASFYGYILYDSFGMASLKKALFWVTVIPTSISGSVNCFQEGCTLSVGRWLTTDRNLPKCSPYCTVTSRCSKEELSNMMVYTLNIIYECNELCCTVKNFITFI